MLGTAPTTSSTLRQPRDIGTWSSSFARNVSDSATNVLSPMVALRWRFSDESPYQEPPLQARGYFAISAGIAERRDELVKDPVCQTYVVMSRALRSEVGGTIVHFCSRECQDKYGRGERHA